MSNMFTYSAVSETIQKKLANVDLHNPVKVFYNDPNPAIKNYQPAPCVLPERFKKFDVAVKDFSVRKDDVWVLSYQKTGSTWSLELVTVLLNGMDFAKIEEHDVTEKCRLFESFLINRLPNKDDPWNIINSTKKRRTFNSHLPINLLPNELLNSSEHKIVYVTRNPKDAAISWYHHFANLHQYNGSLVDFLDCVLSGDMFWGSHFQHTEEYLRLAEVKNNVLVITYEALINDPVSEVKRVAEFLGTPLVDDDAKKVADFIHFDQMKNRSRANREELTERFSRENTDFKFLRKGKSGSSKTEMPTEYIEKFNVEMKKWPRIMKLYPQF